MAHVKWTRSLHPAFVERDGAFCQHIVLYFLFFLGCLAKPSKRPIKCRWSILCSSLISAAQLLPKWMRAFTCCVIRFSRIWLLLFFSGWLRHTTLALVSTFTSPSTTGDLVIQYTSMNKWRYKMIIFGCFFFLCMLQLHLISWFVSTFCLFLRSMQLEKRSLPMEEACHTIMEVLQL